MRQFANFKMDKVELRACFKIVAGFLVLVVVLENGPKFEDDDEDEDDYDSSTAFLKHVLRHSRSGELGGKEKRGRF